MQKPKILTGKEAEEVLSEFNNAKIALDNATDFMQNLQGLFKKHGLKDHEFAISEAIKIVNGADEQLDELNVEQQASIS